MKKVMQFAYPDDNTFSVWLEDVISKLNNPNYSSDWKTRVLSNKLEGPYISVPVPHDNNQPEVISEPETT